LSGKQIILLTILVVAATAAGGEKVLLLLLLPTTTFLLFLILLFVVFLFKFFFFCTPPAADKSRQIYLPPVSLKIYCYHLSYLAYNGWLVYHVCRDHHPLPDDVFFFISWVLQLLLLFLNTI